MAFNLCKAGTYVWDHTVLLHGSAPCKRHGCSWMCGLIRSPMKTPLMVDVVCGLMLAFPQRDLDTTSPPSFRRRAEAGKLHCATVSTCFSLSDLLVPLSRSCLHLPTPHIFFSLVLRTQRGSGTCGHLSKLTCLSERHELTAGKLPKTTTFRSRSPFLS